MSAAESVTIIVDGRPLEARLGESVAAALLRSGGRTLRRTRGGEPRGLFCGIGLCYDCLVTVDGLPGQRACMVEARAGQRVETGEATA
jgi:hypothetical protein